ncbi:MAG: hypothetical protein H3C43_09575 [Leptonema sp. (in: Bacteria)]|nr:hypothetical protein [Leptonema sp. (in: bacteria)]
MRRISISFIVLLFVMVQCSKDPSEVIADLKEDIANLPVNTEDRQEEGEKLLSKIQRLEDTENDKRVQVLSKDTSNAVIAISSDGSTLVANVDNDWIVLSRNGLHSNSGNSMPIRIITSYYGQYVLYATNKNNQCLYSIIDLGNDGSKFDIQRDVLEIDCNNSVVIDDKGQLFYDSFGDVFRYSPKDKTDKKATLILGKSIFKSNYPKIINTLNLISIPDGLWLLYGAAGYYDLYHYSGTPNSARKVYPGVASPTVQYTANSLFSLEGETLTSDNQPTLFLYSGEAGRYSLQGFRLPATPWKSFRVPVRKTVYYLSNFDQFLYVKDNYPVRYNVSTAKEYKLPLRASQIFVHQSGLVYINSKNQLVLRKEPYSDFEKKLFQLKEELEQNLR